MFDQVLMEINKISDYYKQMFWYVTRILFRYDIGQSLVDAYVIITSKYQVIMIKREKKRSWISMYD